MYYELAAGALLQTLFECGPARSENGVNLVKDEPKNIYNCLINVVPNINLDCTIFRPTLVLKMALCTKTTMPILYRYKWNRSFILSFKWSLIASY